MSSIVGLKINKLNSMIINIDGFDTLANSKLVDRNILPVRNWKSGSVAPSFFSNNGTIAENNRDFYTDPWGYQNLIWNSLADGNISSDSGGWNTGNFNITSSVTYRFSTWVNRVVQGTSGNVYLGCNGYGTTNGVYPHNSTSSLNTNPYFYVSSSPPNAQVPTNTWIMIVGHTHGSGYAGGVHVNSRRYTVAGEYGTGITDYKWHPDNNQGRHRSYMYYSGDVTSLQRWIYPRVDKIDGTEPSIDDLLNNRNKLITNVLNNDKLAMLNGAFYDQIQRGYVLDGDDDLIQYNNAPSIDVNNATIHLFVKSDRTDSVEKILMGFPNGSNQRLYIGTHSSKWDFGIESRGWNSGETNTSVVTNKPVLLTLVLSNGVAKLYTNGNLVLTKTYSPFSLSGNSFMFGSNFNPFYYFDGTLYSCQIFNEVFTEENIRNYYLRRKNRFLWQ